MGCGPSRADGWGGGNDGVVSGVGGHREEEDAIGGSIGREASAGLETSPPRPPSGQGRGIAKKLIRKRSWRKSPKEFGDDDDDGVELSASAVDRAARLAWNRGNIDEIGAGKFSDLVIHQQKFLKQVSKTSREMHLDTSDVHCHATNNSTQPLIPPHSSSRFILSGITHVSATKKSTAYEEWHTHPDKC